jgi:hypothetical protein
MFSETAMRSMALQMKCILEGRAPRVRVGASAAQIPVGVTFCFNGSEDCVRSHAEHGPPREIHFDGILANPEPTNRADCPTRLR